MDVRPPDKVFLTPPMPQGQMRAWETLYGFENFSFPEQGGFLAHYQSRIVPNKGLYTSEALEANNVMKRVVMTLVVMLKKPTPKNVLTRLKYLADYLYTPHYLHYRYYNDFSRELFGLVYRFFRRFGYDFNFSYGLGRIPATTFEYETAYRYRGEDIFSATSKVALLANPRKEVKRLEQLYVSRETWTEVKIKFVMVFKLLRFALLFPKVKEAFRFALADCDFKNFQLDEIETVWANRHAEYSFGGVPYAIRQLKQGFKFYV